MASILHLRREPNETTRAIDEKHGSIEQKLSEQLGEKPHIVCFIVDGNRLHSIRSLTPVYHQ
ncbi:hypothetical protein HSR121_0707 [Halapricum desulfuricans]|uniref:Uncharacterized protein n=1 Tax=Halapricum desulfuricans TaxID=2841257 RepID=A0A897MXR2_9EURY|nr:hypothetical protein HSR121_0707 [Halapricum desulfuricans]